MALTGLKVIEFAGLAPGPFAGLVLADNGASVIRVDRPGSQSSDVLARGKRSIAIDVKVFSGRELIRTLLSTADVVIDPFRPGVMERLGLGPEIFLSKKGLNQRIVYARIVGFPRKGPYKDMAGHDLNYLALSGLLPMLPGAEDKPSFPLNLLADFAGGAMTCAVGILLALIERGRTGLGQVVDVDMVSGTRYVSSYPLIHALLPKDPYFGGPRGTNILDGGAPFYGLYTCSDGKWISVGCLEPQFFAVFIERFLKALPEERLHSWVPSVETQFVREEWPELRSFLERGFKSNTRSYWATVFLDTDACVVPVLSPTEASQLAAFDSITPIQHPVIGPSFPTVNSRGYLKVGQHTQEILDGIGINREQQRQLVADGVIDFNRISRL